MPVEQDGCTFGEDYGTLETCSECSRHFACYRCSSNRQENAVFRHEDVVLPPGQTVSIRHPDGRVEIQQVPRRLSQMWRPTPGQHTLTILPLSLDMSGSMSDHSESRWIFHGRNDRYRCTECEAIFRTRNDAEFHQEQYREAGIPHDCIRIQSDSTGLTYMDIEEVIRNNARDVFGEDEWPEGLRQIGEAIINSEAQPVINHMPRYVDLLEDCLYDGTYNSAGLSGRIAREFPTLTQEEADSIIDALLQMDIFRDKQILKYLDGTLVFAGHCPFGQYGIDIDTIDQCTGCPQYTNCSEQQITNLSERNIHGTR